MWMLVQRLGGQLRWGTNGVLGWDFTAVFALSAGLGVSAVAVAAFLPGIEAVAIRAINETLKEDGHA